MNLIKRGHVVPEIDDGYDRVDRVFHDMVRDLFVGGTVLGQMLDPSKAGLRVEEDVTEGVYTLRAEIPGIDPDKDVEITVADGALTISAHRAEHTEQKHDHLYRSEFHYGSFARTVRLPKGIEQAAIKATYENGILSVRVPLPDPTAAPVSKIAIDHS